MKTQSIEFKEVGGSYDGKLILTRDSSGNFVITTPAGTLKIKDGKITASGNIIVDGGYIGLTSDPDLLSLLAGQLLVNGLLFSTQGIISGTIGSAGSLILKDTSNNTQVLLDGQPGDGTFKGGLNVGTASGALTGDGKFSGNIYTSGGQLIYSPDFLIRSNTTDGSDNLRAILCGGGAASTSRGAYIYVTGNEDTPGGRAAIIGPGGIYLYGDTVLDSDLDVADDIISDTSQLRINTSAPPTASAANSGTFYYQQDTGDNNRGKLLFCVRMAISEGYQWKVVVQGDDNP